jgi:hypothetical protein
MGRKSIHVSSPRGICSVWTVGSGGGVVRGEIRRVLSTRVQFLLRSDWRRIPLFGVELCAYHVSAYSRQAHNL